MTLRPRVLAFVVICAVTASTLLAGAQTKQPAKAAKPARPAKAAKPTKRPSSAGAKPPSPDADDAGALATKDERPSAATSKDAGTGGSATFAKTLDGGTRVFRFGEVEVEGRLKSPQIVYFLRRVRAEFAAGDLGHRSFVRELSETRNEPGL